MTDLSSAVVERCPETGLLVGYVPGIPGAHSQAESLDELMANLREVLELLAEDATIQRAAAEEDEREPVTMRMQIELDRETDGRWLADVPELPGVIVYGSTRAEAVSGAQALALRVIADRIEHGELRPGLLSIRFEAARADH